MPLLRRAIIVVLALAVALSTVLFGSGQGFAQSAQVLRNRINQGTVAIVSGGVNGTYIRIAADLASVLDNGDELRVLPILGKGSVRNISDLLYLRGVDLAIVQSDVLSYIREQNIHPNIEQRIRYITKLYNEEVHVLAGPDIKSLKDLAGEESELRQYRKRDVHYRFDHFQGIGHRCRTDDIRSGVSPGKVEGGRDCRDGLRCW